MSTKLDQQLHALAEQALAAHGLVLVAARLTGGTASGRGKLTLDVMAENPDGSSPTLDQCTQASRTISAQLDVADILPSAYTLEVGTPGMERPLNTLADYQRFMGKQARVSLHRPLPNPSGKGVLGTAIGAILAASEDEVTIALKDGEGDLTIPFSNVKYAHLSPSAEELKQLMQQANSKRKEADHGA
jgi:ribosome maturation factor RimP